MFFSPEQKDSLRQLAEVKVLQNQNKGISQVSNDISFGLRGNTPKESHRGIQDYQDLITTAVAKQDPQLIETVLTDLEAWTHNHANKSEAFKQAADRVGSSNKKVQVVALGNNDYRLIQDPKQFLSAKALRANGGFEFHKGSNQSNVVERVASEAQLIGKTYQALSNYASSFSFNQENNNPESNQNTETTNSASTNSIDIPETQLDSAQPQQDTTPPSLEGMELVFNDAGVGSVQPKNLSQENTAKTVSESALTPDEISVVDSQVFKDWFGDLNEQESTRSGQLGRSAGSNESTENRQTSDSRGASDSRSSDDTRQDVRGDDGLNETSSGNPKKKSTKIEGKPYQGTVSTKADGTPHVDKTENNKHDTVPEAPLTPDETNVVNSEQFKNWFGDINAREEINSRGIRGEGTGNKPETSTGTDRTREARTEGATSSDNSRHDIRRSHQDNQTSTRRKAITGKSYQGNVAVTDLGKPQLWFHGTAGDFTEFDLNHSDHKDTG